MAREDRSKASKAPIDKSLTDLFGELEKGDINAQAPPSIKLVEWFHRNVSTERDADVHHRLGSSKGDAARGEHTHDGKDSLALFPTSGVPASPSATVASLKTAVDQLITLVASKAG